MSVTQDAMVSEFFVGRDGRLGLRPELGQDRQGDLIQRWTAAKPLEEGSNSVDSANESDGGSGLRRNYR